MGASFPGEAGYELRNGCEYLAKRQVGIVWLLPVLFSPSSHIVKRFCVLCISWPHTQSRG